MVILKWNKVMTQSEKDYGIIPIDAFFRDVLVCFGDKQTFKEALIEYHTEEEADSIMGEMDFSLNGHTFYDTVFRAFILWMPKKPETAQDWGFLSHEIFHTAYAVMRKIGVTPSDDSEEVYAYLISYLTKRIIEGFNLISSCPSQ